MFKPEYTARFKKDYKLIQKRGYKLDALREVIRKLLNDETPLPQNNKDHELNGEFAGYRECHVGPDWLLIYYYKVEDVIVFARTGTHSDLFK